TGVLAYQTGDPNSELVWFDRSGKKLGTIGEPRNYGMVSLSPDGQSIAASLMDSDGRVADIWLLDLKRDNIATRLTFEPSMEGDPVWSPDGRKILFSSTRSSSGSIDLYQKPAGGTGDDQFQGQISPDGHYIAYTSHELGKWDVYIQPLALTGEKWRISSNGGVMPLWRNDGKELFYITTEGALMSVEITTSPKFEGGVPRQLFQANMKSINQGWCYGVTNDGQRFLVNTFVQNLNSAAMT